MEINKDQSSKNEVDQRTCFYCHNPFQAFVYNPEAFMNGKTPKHYRRGCVSCGIPVCYDCASIEGMHQGKPGHCICPKCGADL